MKQQGILSDFIYQVFSLLLALIVVHALYVAVIRPNADAVLAQQAALYKQDPNYIAPQSFYVILKDYEQESCVILTLWAFALLGMKIRRNLKEGALLERSLLHTTEGISILPQDARDFARPLQALPLAEREYLLPRTLLSALHRFSATRSISDVSSVVNDICDNEANRLDNELSIIRYIAWAIPSIGFIGTVRGIGQALSQAQQAVQGDVMGVTVSLGVAFNSTLIALVVSIFIMFLLYQLQLMQDRLVLNTKSYCDSQLIRHLQVNERFNERTAERATDESTAP
jgi:biopolymer transport protein ExbB/TolQ